MEFKEKAKIRIQHWLKHNQEHAQEYQNMARELEANGLPEVAEAIMALAKNTELGSACLQKAISALEK